MKSAISTNKKNTITSSSKNNKGGVGGGNHGQDVTFQPLKESTNQSEFLKQFNQMDNQLTFKSNKSLFVSGNAPMSHGDTIKTMNSNVSPAALELSQAVPRRRSILVNSSIYNLQQKLQFHQQRQSKAAHGAGSNNGSNGGEFMDNTAGKKMIDSNGLSMNKMLKSSPMNTKSGCQPRRCNSIID
jgi:hypothetical protein